MDHDVVHIDLSAKPVWYRNVHPKGLVPALKHRAEIHTESLDICKLTENLIAQGYEVSDIVMSMWHLAVRL